MVKVKKIAPTISENYSFLARANVNFSLPVNKYEKVRKYNEDFLERLRDVNGEGARIPAEMNYRWVSRGDILYFGEEIVVDEDTGNIRIFPTEIYDDLSKHTVELPCSLSGRVDKHLATINALSSPGMRKALAGLKEETARFRVKPFLEKYNENDPDLED